MSRNKIFAIITAISVSACLYACGSDDDTNPGGGAGSSGHAGKAGSGSAGKGGTGGGGKPSGGSGNEAGEENGSAGEGGADNAGGAGGDTGAAGDGNGAGGDGGAAGGGGTEQTLTEACATSCGPSHTVTDCSSTLDECNSQCTVYPTQVEQQIADAQVAARLNAEYLDLVRCMATHLTATSQYICAADGTMVGKTSPATETVCEDELCKWTCDDGNNGTAGADLNVFERCGC